MSRFALTLSADYAVAPRNPNIRVSASAFAPAFRMFAAPATPAQILAARVAKIAA